MVILRSQNKITDFLMILAWASPFNQEITLEKYTSKMADKIQMSNKIQDSRYVENDAKNESNQ